MYDFTIKYNTYVGERHSGQYLYLPASPALFHPFPVGSYLTAQFLGIPFVFLMVLSNTCALLVLMTFHDITNVKWFTTVSPELSRSIALASADFLYLLMFSQKLRKTLDTSEIAF